MKLCVTGHSNLFQFWHCNLKSTHSAPIDGLQKGSHCYTCHVWLGHNRVVAGTDSGCLSVVQGIDQIALLRPLEKFQSTGYGHIDLHEMNADHSVKGLLLKADKLIAYSSDGKLALYLISYVESMGGRIVRRCP